MLILAPGFAKELPNKKAGRPLATGEEINQQIRHYLADLRKRGCIVTTADVSLGLPGSLSQENSVPSMGALQTSLYLWYPLTTLNIKTRAPFFELHVMYEINDCGLFKYSVAHCNYREG